MLSPSISALFFHIIPQERVFCKRFGAFLPFPQFPENFFGEKKFLRLSFKIS